MWYIINSNELYHHGVKGQKWGVRRYQNPDGTLTEDGKRRYSYDVPSAKAELKSAKKQIKAAKRSRYETKEAKKNAVTDAKHGKAIAKGKISIERAKRKLDGKKFKVRPGKTRDHYVQMYKELGLSEENAVIATRVLESMRNRAFGVGTYVGYSQGSGN